MRRNIGILHYKVGGTDGVSLEIDKIKYVLEDMGHLVYLCAGDLGHLNGTRIEELYHHRPEARRLYHNTFESLSDYDETEYSAELYRLAQIIEDRLETFIVDNDIDYFIPQNVWSVAINPAVAIALTRVLRRLDIPALAFNHDFYWERVNGVALTCGTAVALADKYLPPRDPLFKMVVINSLAQKELKERKGIEAQLIPNVFDFADKQWQADAYNRSLRAEIGLSENDIFILQATRIVPRKGIELAIDFVKALDRPERRALLYERGLYDGRPFDADNRIVLVLAGYDQDDFTGGYLDRLKLKIDRAGIEAIFIGDLIASQRQYRGNKKIYSLWDSYVYADLVTYPSLWEGWGNQLLETMFARLPVVLFEYPVYRVDLRNTGIRAVSLGSEYIRGANGLVHVDPAIIEAAANEAIDLLTDSQLRQEMVDNNFRIGLERYSLSALQSYLYPLVGSGNTNHID